MSAITLTSPQYLDKCQSAKSVQHFYRYDTDRFKCYTCLEPCNTAVAVRVTTKLNKQGDTSERTYSIKMCQSCYRWYKIEESPKEEQPEVKKEETPKLELSYPVGQPGW